MWSNVNRSLPAMKQYDFCITVVIGDHEKWEDSQTNSCMCWQINKKALMTLSLCAKNLSIKGVSSKIF